MKSKLFYLFLILSLSACKSSKTVRVPAGTQKASIVKNTSTHKKAKHNKNTSKIIQTALSYNGTKYRYGGTTKKGMDCSGLIYTSFTTHNVSLPRTSSMMSTQGKKIQIREAREGDLLFFRTNKKKKGINHVGLIVATNGDDIKFIHATTSRGVIVSSIKEGYWNYAFVEARRVL
ncbi:C40 family peptidase [Abyssalbus ytuae]|uniref:C40 family peptidase n=1 Tax=Abyssalbus ytuae TaxID=2926907 RepID=A0A9E6ZMQ9_9FLAO|nr:C40 family peptidase [Abyssalbus ytuae]UOB18719.1 C40 family peptidase [Abyssalbus ytuae]